MAMLLAGCSPVRLLGPRQQLLTQVELKGTDQADREALILLYRQRPNSNFPVPRLALYNLGYTFFKPEKAQAKLKAVQQKYNADIAAAGTDSVKLGKLIQKRERQVRHYQQLLEKGNVVMRLGESPVIYDSLLTAITAEQMLIYLRSKGFFHAKVQATDTTRNRRTTVTYRVAEGRPFLVSELAYEIADSGVTRLLRADTTRSLLRVGQRYNEQLIGAERTRLEALLQNSGYFDFRQQYITLEADTSFAPYTVRLRLQIANPPDEAGHYAYKVRNVNFLTDAGVNRFGIVRDTVRRKGVNYLAYNHRFSTRILDRKLLVRPGDRYSLTNTIQTQRELGNLDVFRFAAVNYQKVAGNDSTGFRQLDATVSATPQKRYQYSSELGGTYVAGLPGPFGNFRVRVRNAFGGAEVLEIGLRAGLEGQFALSGGGEAQGQRDLTTQLGANVNLTLPQFLLPWHSNKLFTRYSPRTRLTTSFTYVDRQEYTRTNLEATYDYIWQYSNNFQFVLTPLSLSLINTTQIDDTFQVRLARLPNGQALLRSFQSVLVPASNATMVYNTNDFNQTLDARFLRLFAEVGGLGRGLYTQKSDSLNGTDYQIGNSKVQVYDYFRLSADYRRYHKLTPRQFFVWRINTGLARALTRTRIRERLDAPDELAFSPPTAIIPYDRYLFAGGGSSLRAWLPRRLGTGSYPTTVQTPNGPVRSDFPEQPGELLLEGSMEYRFPIYDYIHGAAFTDFGNVWILDRDPERPGADFALNRFYREIAVSTGLGLRFDFSFLILRLDFAAKVYDPTEEPGQRFVLPKVTVFDANSNTKLRANVGIGYPF